MTFIVICLVAAINSQAFAIIPVCGKSVKPGLIISINPGLIVIICLHANRKIQHTVVP